MSAVAGSRRSASAMTPRACPQGASSPGRACARARRTRAPCATHTHAERAELGSQAATTSLRHTPYPRLGEGGGCVFPMGVRGGVVTRIHAVWGLGR
jgi:hypothetical protein